MLQAASVSREIRDGDWTLLTWDPATGRTTWGMFEGDKFIVRTDMPVQSIIDENTRVRNDTPDGWKGDYHRIASIPMPLLYDENLGLNKAILQGDDRYLSRWLNDSDNEAFRTKRGNV